MHKLTEKIWNCFNTEESLDRTIRQELGKMAEKIAEYCGPVYMTKKKAQEILGLSEKPKEKHENPFKYPPLVQGTPQQAPTQEIYNQCGNCGKMKKTISCEYCFPPTQESGEWCEHKLFVESIHCSHTFRFCPICGTSRPSKPSMREELAEKFKHYGFQQGKITSDECMKLAEIAEEVFRKDRKME